MLHLTLFASYGLPSGSLADPPGSSVVVAGMAWFQQTLLGTVATTVAIMAVASVGLMMLTGQIHARYGLTVIAGCFILFGASTIVAGVQSSLAGSDRGSVSYAQESYPPVVAAPLALPSPSTNNSHASCPTASITEVSLGDCGLRMKPTVH